MAKAVKKKKPKPKKEIPTKLNMSFEDAIQMSFAPKVKKQQ
jgi:hypothetical protein